MKSYTHFQLIVMGIIFCTTLGTAYGIEYDVSSIPDSVVITDVKKISDAELMWKELPSKFEVIISYLFWGILIALIGVVGIAGIYCGYKGIKKSFDDKYWMPKK